MESRFGQDPLIRESYRRPLSRLGRETPRESDQLDRRTSRELGRLGRKAFRGLIRLCHKSLRQWSQSIRMTFGQLIQLIQPVQKAFHLLI